jgi:protein arginine kinase activator
MICHRCEKNPVSVHVTEVKKFGTPGDPQNEVEEQHLCAECAQQLELPHVSLSPKATLWNLLQFHAHKVKTLTCPDCGMTLEELRRRGRVGCAKDYDVFRDYLDELLSRMHGSGSHVGRLPGVPEGSLERIHQMTTLKGELDLAIRDEDYERAATLRDEIQDLETSGSEVQGSGTESGPEAH